MTDQYLPRIQNKTSFINPFLERSRATSGRMDDRWNQIRQLFRAAQDLDTGARQAYLDEQCANDPELRQRVATMLEAFDREAYEDDDTFLAKPVVDFRERPQQGNRDPDSLIGTQVGSYLIRRLIAQGGMGVVFEAFDTKLEKIVALKMMHPFLMQDKTFKKRFEQEAKTLARLEDPHFVRVYALIEERERTFIVMEYIQGLTLAEHIRSKRRLAPREVIGIGTQLLTALSKAHKQHIVHRDLKPSNIMLTRTDAGKSLVKVLDFGIAKQIQANNNQTRTQGTVGTLYYMSPEQVRALPTIDHRTDIYSAGVTLFEALSGDLPFDVTRDEFAIRKQIVEGKHDRLPTPIVDVSGVLGHVLSKAMEPEPDARYQTAEAMRSALRAALQDNAPAAPGRQVQAVEPAIGNKAPILLEGERPPIPPKSTRQPGRMLTSIVLIVLTGLVGVLWFTRSSTPTSDPMTNGEATEATGMSGTAIAERNTATDTTSSITRPTNTALELPTPDQTDPTASNTRTAETGTQAQTQTQPATSDEFPPDTPTIQPTTPLTQSADSATFLAERPSTDSISPSSEPTQTPDIEAPGAKGMLFLRIRPGGDVYIDDELYVENEIATRIPLNAGSHMVSIQNDAYGTWTCDVSIVPELESDITVAFDQTVPVTVVAVAEEGDNIKPIRNAPIFIDGAPTGHTTPMKLPLQTGLHLVEVKNPGYRQVRVVAEESRACYHMVDDKVNMDPSALNQTAQPRLVVYLSPE